MATKNTSKKATSTRLGLSALEALNASKAKDAADKAARLAAKNAVKAFKRAVKSAQVKSYVLTILTAAVDAELVYLESVMAPSVREAAKLPLSLTTVLTPEVAVVEPVTVVETQEQIVEVAPQVNSYQYTFEKAKGRKNSVRAKWLSLATPFMNQVDEHLIKLGIKVQIDWTTLPREWAGESGLKAFIFLDSLVQGQSLPIYYNEIANIDIKFVKPVTQIELDQFDDSQEPEVKVLPKPITKRQQALATALREAIIKQEEEKLLVSAQIEVQERIAELEKEYKKAPDLAYSAVRNEVLGALKFLEVEELQQQAAINVATKIDAEVAAKKAELEVESKPAIRAARKQAMLDIAEELGVDSKLLINTFNSVVKEEQQPVVVVVKQTVKTTQPKSKKAKPKQAKASKKVEVKPITKPVKKEEQTSNKVNNPVFARPIKDQQVDLFLPEIEIIKSQADRITELKYTLNELSK